MKNHNWKLLGLTMALALLFACLLGGAALAEDPEPDETGDPEVRLYMLSKGDDPEDESDFIYQTEIDIHGYVAFWIYAPDVEDELDILVDDQKVRSVLIDGDSDPVPCFMSFDDEAKLVNGTHDFKVVAQARFEGEAPDPDVVVNSKPCTVRVSVNDEVHGSISYTTDDTEVHQDDLLTIDATFTPETDDEAPLDFFGAYLYRENGDGSRDVVMEPSAAESVRNAETTLDEGTIYMPVGKVEPGKYKLCVFAARVGALTIDSEQEMEITVNQPKYASDVLISVRDNVVTGEPIGLTAFYKNPDNLDDLCMNVCVYPKDNPGNWVIEENDIYEMEYENMWTSVPTSGTYVVEVNVWQEIEGMDDDGEDLGICHATREFTATAPKGKLTISQDDLPVLPAYLQSGETELLIPLPKAPVQWMDVEIRDGNYRDIDSAYGVTNDETMTFDLDDEECVIVEVYYNAVGYDQFHYTSKCIPVVHEGSAPGNAVWLKLDKSIPVEDGVALVPVNQRIDFTVGSNLNDGRLIREIHFFDGEWYQYGVLNDDEMDANVWHSSTSFGIPGEYTLCAEVTFDLVEDEDWDWENDGDPRTWYLTNLVPVDILKPEEGKTLSPITVELVSDDPDPKFVNVVRSDATKVQVKVTQTVVEDATQQAANDAAEYNLGVFDERYDYIDSDWHWQGDWKDAPDGKSRSRTALLETITLPDGELRVGCHGSYTGYAYTSAEADRQLNVKDTNKEGDVVFGISKTNVQTNEDFALWCYAPGARVIELTQYCADDDDDDIGEWWDESLSTYKSIGDAGVYQLQARAWYRKQVPGSTPAPDSGDENRSYYKDSKPIEVTVTADPTNTIAFADDDIVVPLVLQYHEGTEQNDYTPTLDDLTVTVKKPANAQKFDVQIKVDKNGEDFTCTDKNPDDDVIQYTLGGKAMLEKGIDPRYNNIVRVEVNAYATNYNGAHTWKFVPVVGEDLSDKLTLTVGGKPDSVSAEVSTDVDLAIAAADGYTIQDVTLYDGEDFWNPEAVNDQVYENDIDFNDDGTYYVFAKVNLLNDNTGAVTAVRTNAVKVVVTSQGEVGPFDISLDKTTVTSGEPVRVTFTQAANAVDYDLDVDDRLDDVLGENDDHWRYDYDWAWADEWSDPDNDGIFTRTAILSTAGLPETEDGYWVSAGAGAEGYRGRGTKEYNLMVKDPEDMPEVLFTVDRDEVLTSEDFTFSVRAPGANKVEVYMDYPSSWCESRDRSQFSRPISYQNPGTYQLRAHAYLNDGGEVWSDIKTVTVTATDDPLSFDSVPDDIPAYLVCNENGVFASGLSFNVYMPANAETLSVQLWEDDNYFKDFDQNDAVGNAVPVAVSADELTAQGMRPGDVLYVTVYAGARNRAGASWEIAIPIVASAPNNKSATIALEGGLNPDEIPLNKDLTVRVSPKNTTDQIQAARFYDGYTLRNNSMRRQGGDYTEGTSYDRPGTYHLFALVTFEPGKDYWEEGDTRNWVRTEAITVTVLPSDNKVGPFKILLDKDEVVQGEFVRVTFTKSQDATDYYFEDTDNGFDRDDWSWDEAADGRVAVIDTSRLNPDDYTLTARARADGYEAYVAESRTLTVNERDGQDVLFEVSADKVVLSQDLFVNLNAPGAEATCIILDKNDDDKAWGVEFNSATYTFYNESEAGEHTLTAYAWYEGDDDPQLVGTKTFEVVCNGVVGPVVVTGIPTYLKGDEQESFTVSKPENAEGMNVWIVACNSDKDRETVPGMSWESLTGDKVITLDASKLKVGNKTYEYFRVEAYAYATGCQGSSFGENIRVVPASGGEVATASIATVERDGEVISYNDGDPIHYDDEVTVEISLNDPYKTIESVRFFNGDSWENNGEPILNDDDHAGWYNMGAFLGGVARYNTGRRAIYAEVKIVGDDTTYYTNVLELEFTCLGQIAGFDFASLRDVRAARGDEAVFTFTGSESLRNYNVTLYELDDNGEFRRDKNGEFISVEYPYTPRWEDDDDKVYLDTTNLPEGDYGAQGYADLKAGWQWAENEERTSAHSVKLTVTKHEGARVQLTIGKEEVQTFEPMAIHVKAVGASKVGLSINGQRMDMDENGNLGWDGPEWDDNKQSWWNDVGDYEAKAWALFDEDEGWVEGESRTFTAEAEHGKTPLDLRNVPATVLEGYGATFKIPYPVGATYFGYMINLNGKNVVQENEPEVVEDVDGNYVSITIPTNYVISANDMLDLGVWTGGGVGYEPTNANKTIRVVPAPDNNVTLTIAEPADGKYLRREEYTATITAPAEKTEALFYNGEIDWGNGGVPMAQPVALSTGEGDTVAKGTVTFECNELGEHQMYASVKNGEDTWIASETQTVTIETNGKSPVVDVTVPEIIWAGNNAVFTIADPEPDCWYSLSVYPKNGGGNLLGYQYEDGDHEKTFTIDKDDLVAGTTYVVDVWFDADGPVAQTQVIKYFRVVAPSVQLSADKQIYHLGDAVTFTIKAPLSKSVTLYQGSEEVKTWTEGTDNISHEWTPDALCPDGVTLTAKATFEGTSVPVEASVTVKVTSRGPAPEPEVTIPDNITCGDTRSITVNPDEGAKFTLSVYSDDTQDPVMTLDQTAQSYAVALADLPAGHYTAKLSYGKQGYDDVGPDVIGEFDIRHDYNATFDDVTTDKDGALVCKVTLVCSGCADNSNVLDADLKEIISQRIDPTCTAEGTRYYNASVKDEYNKQYKAVVTQTIPKVPHNWGAAAWTWEDDCSKATATWTCADCDATEVVDVTPVAGEVTKQPTCGETGIQQYSATAKSTNYPELEETDTHEKVLDATGIHNYGEWHIVFSGDIGNVTAVAVRECDDCGHPDTPQAVIALDSETTATCEKDGVRTYTASITIDGVGEISDTKDYNEKAFGHDWSAWSQTVAPTCHSYGTDERECSRCHTKQTRNVGKRSHTWGEITFEWADDYSKVTGTRHCMNDGCTETESKFVRATVTTSDGSCNAPGETTYTIADTSTFNDEAFDTAFDKSTIERTKTVENSEALGHDFGATTYVWADDNSKVTATRKCKRTNCTETETVEAAVTSTETPPTCTEEGDTKYTATFDANSFVKGATKIKHEPIDALKHDLEHHDAKAPTCTEVGWEAYDTCKRNGCDYTTYVEIPALQHDLEHHDAKAPTCTEVGWEAYDTCRRDGCGYTTYVEIPALGHSWNAPAYAWSDDNKTVTATATCKNGDHPTTETVKTEFKQTKAPTYTEKGEGIYTATFENTLFKVQTKTVEIPMLGKDDAVKAVESRISALKESAGLEDKEAVAAVRAAYENLTEAQKQQVDSGLVDKLKSAEESVKAAEAEAEKKAAEEAAQKEKADADAAQGVANAINALGDNPTKEAVAAARAAYEALTDAQKAKVSADVLAKLTTAEAKVKAAEEAAQQEKADAEAARGVADIINALGDNPTKEAVEAARAAYDKLTDAQKAKVSADVLAKLTTAEAKVKAAEEAAQQEQADAEAARGVANIINALGDNPTKEAVEAARAAYDKLTDAQKAKVSADVLAKLTTAEAKVKAAEEAAQQEKADAEAAQGVADIINALGDNPTKEAIEAARAAYDKLTDAQKAMVPADVLSRLTAAEEAARQIDIGTCEITVKDVTFTGKAVTAKAMKKAVTVKYDGNKLTEGADYTFTYNKKAKAIGAYKLTVTGMGRYIGSVKMTFNVVPKGTAFSKVTGGDKQVTLKWKSQKNITGYQIEYSLKKDFSGSKKVTVKKAKTLTTTIKKLKAGKTYYVRIRTYTTVKKKNYYSAWSKAKAVKTKAGKAKNESNAPDIGAGIDVDDMLFGIDDISGEEIILDDEETVVDVEVEVPAE